jgi:type I restriction enzyme S subunit
MSIASALMSTNQQINAVIVSGGHDPEYAYHALMQIAPNMRLLAGEQAVPMLNKKDFSALKIVLPPLPEQHRIAAILGTWDRAIATVQQLLAAQQKRKRGLMQELLSGIYHRVKKVDIGSVATEVTVRNVDNAEYPVLSCSKHVGFVSSLEYFKKQVYSDDRSNYKVIRKGQFGFPANHIEEGSIDLLRIHDIGVVSPIYVIFEFDGESVNSEFMRYLFKTERYRHIFSTSTNASVDRRGSLRWKDFQTIAVPLPHKQEQDRIANVFQRLDALIESQEALLTRLTAQKRGLMQQLLTGRVRVKHSIQ